MRAYSFQLVRRFPFALVLFGIILRSSTALALEVNFLTPMQAMRGCRGLLQTVGQEHYDPFHRTHADWFAEHLTEAFSKGHTEVDVTLLGGFERLLLLQGLDRATAQQLANDVARIQSALESYSEPNSRLSSMLRSLDGTMMEASSTHPQLPIFLVGYETESEPTVWHTQVNPFYITRLATAATGQMRAPSAALPPFGSNPIPAYVAVGLPRATLQHATGKSVITSPVEHVALNIQLATMPRKIMSKMLLLAAQREFVAWMEIQRTLSSNAQAPIFSQYVRYHIKEARYVVDKAFYELVSASLEAKILATIDQAIADHYLITQAERGQLQQTKLLDAETARSEDLDWDAIEAIQPKADRTELARAALKINQDLLSDIGLAKRQITGALLKDFRRIQKEQGIRDRNLAEFADTLLNYSPNRR